MKLEIIRNKYFALGWLGCTAFHCMYQDFLGKEKYIESVNNYWIDEKYGLLFSFIIIMMVFCTYGSEKEDSQR
jgi:hypothetical protein